MLLHPALPRAAFVTLFVAAAISFVLTLPAAAQDRESLPYIIIMKSGDAFRGDLLDYTDTTMTVRTAFGRVTIPKDRIAHFEPVNGSYLRLPYHFIMPTASPNGPGGFLSNYELGFFYGGVGIEQIVTLTAGATLAPGVPLGSQLYHASAKVTLTPNYNAERPGFEVALGLAGTWLTTDHFYSHAFAVATFSNDRVRWSAMIYQPITGDSIAHVAVPFFETDTLRFAPKLARVPSFVLGFEAPFFIRDDIRLVAEVWGSPFISELAAVLLAGRVTNERLTGDFGFALIGGSAIVPITRFSWRF